MLSAGCATLPPQDGRTESRALADTASTRLGRATADAAAAHPGKSGIRAMPMPPDAFAARVLLAAAAERSLDLQYYIWNGDETGVLLYEAVWRAAGRGVRVRILLDDANTGGLDATLAALDAHPSIEVRLYNPLPMRNARLLNLATDFARVNRRMHNKSFTADNQASIVGGRNGGNEYFAAGEGVAFADLDVLAIESNYDPHLQRTSGRPIFLQQRIMGGKGHLSNQQAFDAVRAVLDRCERSGARLPSHIVLLHRSRDCNCPRLLRQLFVRDARIAPRLTLAEPFEPSGWLKVRERAPLMGEQLALSW
jgi:hypothetical protein